MPDVQQKKEPSATVVAPHGELVAGAIARLALDIAAAADDLGSKNGRGDMKAWESARKKMSKLCEKLGRVQWSLAKVLDAAERCASPMHPSKRAAASDEFSGAVAHLLRELANGGES